MRRPSWATCSNGRRALGASARLGRCSRSTAAAACTAATPRFEGGRREAGIQNAGGEFDVALARYREQVLVAFADVEDQLSSLRLLAEQSEAQDRPVASASRSTALSDVRSRHGHRTQL